MKPARDVGARKLYAVAAERFVRTSRGLEWVADGMTYVHAFSEANARCTFLASRTDCVRVVACGLTIGYFQDRTGNITT